MISVSVIVINYDSDKKMLSDCLTGFLNQKGAGVELIVFDNNSGNASEVESLEKQLVEDYPHFNIRFYYSRKNIGFAEAVNKAVSLSKGEYVFISNFDVIVMEDTLWQAIKIMQKCPDCAGIAPKVYFMYDKKLLDNMGTCIDTFGTAFNRGIGQHDLGQYDIVDRVFGLCFSACLVKREMFDDSKVGPLDKDFFLFIEDIDWCYRANLLGYKFYSAPLSIVYHYHSISLRNLHHGLRYKLTERNILYTLIKNFELRHLKGILLKRVSAHFKNFILGVYRVEILKIYVRLIQNIFNLLRKRKYLTKRRKLDDFSIFLLSYYEIPYFNPAIYSPVLCTEALISIYKRLYLIKGREKDLKILQFLEISNKSNLKLQKAFLSGQNKQMFKDEPEEIKEYINKLIPESC